MTHYHKVMRNNTMKVPARFLPALLLGAAVAAITALSCATSAVAQEKEKGPKNSPALAKPLEGGEGRSARRSKYPDAIAKLKAAEGDLEARRPTTSTSSTRCCRLAYIKTQQLSGGRQGDGGEARQTDSRQQSEQPTLHQGSWRRSTTRSRTTTRRSSSATAPSRAASPTMQMTTIVGQSYYLKGDWKGTLKFEERYRRCRDQGRADAYQRVAAADLQRLREAAGRGLSDTTRWKSWCSYYPKPEYWQQLLYGMRRTTSGNETQLLQTYRLMPEVDVLKEAGATTPRWRSSRSSGLARRGAAGAREGIARRTCSLTSAPRTRPAAARHTRRRPRPRGPGRAGEDREGSRRRAHRRSRTSAVGLRVPGLSASTTRRSISSPRDSARASLKERAPRRACCSASRSSRPATRTTRSSPSTR